MTVLRKGARASIVAMAATYLLNHKGFLLRFLETITFVCAKFQTAVTIDFS